MKTYRDFVTRSEFIDYLALYEKKTADEKDFVCINRIDPSNYMDELNELKTNIDEIKQSWNNQSINQIEKSVAAKGQRQLDIMQGQRLEKILAGYQPNQPQYRVNNCAKNSFFTGFAQTIGLTNSLARFHVQFPGEVTAWHTDIFSPAHEFLADLEQDLDDDVIGQDRNIRRVLIALEDHHPGQFFLFGDTPWVRWTAGEVIAWNYGVPHGSANMGYSPRITVSITGLVTDKFMSLINDARSL